ncbi:MAG TPA: ABC transporter permease subunit, partial [Euzebya sp.]|nr:ABC transporter permease subunit [Euzebya sp.]
MSAVLWRTLRSERRSALGWVVGVIALGLITTGSWPAVKDSTDELEQVIGNLPPAVSAFFGDGIATFSAAAIIGSRLFGTIGLVLFIGFAISRGARAIAGEEGDGTLELLVVQPLSRRAIAVDKVVATWVSLAVL